jgi:hypothetical protein
MPSNVETAKGISYEMENKFGYSAAHVGKASSDRVKPGGNLVLAIV